MQQLILDISSKKDADLIVELMKHFKSVQINRFEADLTRDEIRSRIDEGLKDIEEDNIESWEDVKAELMKRLDG